MSTDHDYSGDYGYDLAHEVKAFLHDRPGRSASLPVQRSHGPRREIDVDGDLGYDMAHEL